MPGSSNQEALDAVAPTTGLNRCAARGETSEPSVHRGLTTTPTNPYPTTPARNLNLILPGAFETHWRGMGVHGHSRSLEFETIPTRGACSNGIQTETRLVAELNCVRELHLDPWKTE